VGLVVITPAAGYVSVQSSICIGFIGAIVCNIACTIKSKTNLDDTLDVFPCHGTGGMTGLICTGFFARGVGVVAGEGKTFGYHWLALIIVASYVFTVSLILYKVLNFIMPMRVDRWKEEQGLDVSQHGESLYTYDNILDASTCSVSTAVRKNSLMPMRASAVAMQSSEEKNGGEKADHQPPPIPDISADNLPTPTSIHYPTPAYSPFMPNGDVAIQV
jgi:phage shock protein PspC (stress-responsive transcriptional regulator)